MGKATDLFELGLDSALCQSSLVLTQMLLGVLKGDRPLQDMGDLNRFVRDFQSKVEEGISRLAGRG